MFFKEKRNLKAEIDELKDDLSAAQGEVTRLRGLCQQQITELECERKMAENLRAALATAKSRITDKDKIIRKQTEADLLINALQSVGIIPNKEEKKPDYFDREKLYMERLGGLQGQAAHGLQGLGAQLASQYFNGCFQGRGGRG